MDDNLQTYNNNDENGDNNCPVLNRVEQQRNFGIDCGDEILFAAGAWAPGGEHTKKMHVKNVSNRTLKLKYELPRTKYFSMDFPVLITLSPGTSRIFDIAFRPVQYEEYDDYIHVHVHIIEGGVKATSGSFRLPVKARIAMLNTKLPHGIDFGFCPTAETTEYQFQLQNTGQMDATFQWTLPDAGEHGRPFSIRPPTGEIKAGQSLEMTATFSPKTASVYVVTARFLAQECMGGDTHQQQEKTMKISGIGKYAFFAASENELDFGDVLVGVNNNNTSKNPTEKEFVLRNRSLVRASFHIVPVETDHEPLYLFSPLRGVIPPEASVPITVKYTPLSPGTFTCDNFHIKTPGGHTVRVTCKGKAVGPLVSLWKKNLASNLIKATSINFKDVQVGETSTRVLIIKNESNVSVRFNFMAAANGVFAMDKVTGIVPPLLEASIMLTFRPEFPGNFYRRMFLLVQNQSTMYVDVLGTGYDSEVRPSPFQQAHVDAYRLRCENHWGHLSPDGLETLLEEKGDEYFLHGALRRAAELKDMNPPRLLTRSGESLAAEVAISDEYFRLLSDHRGHAISVSETLLEFGAHGAKKTLVVTNHTKGKVTCGWRISEPTNATSPNQSGRANFRISPACCDVAPGASVDFTVSFDPHQTNAYYFAELESHVYFKSNRTFRLVNPETFTPPWCVVVHASGHTFASNESQFLSKVTFVTAKEHICPFPPAHVGDSVYQTVSLVNASDTPALFSVVQDPTKVFWVHPPSGLIPPNGFHLVQIRFTPPTARRYLYRLKTIVNYVSTVTLDLTGMGCRPQLECLDVVAPTQPIDRIFIKPTAVGLSSTRQFLVHNASRVPLVFRWQLPASLQSTFQLTPVVQRLYGNEIQLIKCVFSPSQLKQYNQRVIAHVKSIVPKADSKSTGVVQETSVKLLGVGTSGAVTFVPTTLELPTVLVNSPTTLSFHLVNSSDCDLQYKLMVHIRTMTSNQSSGSDLHDNNDHDLHPDTYITFSKPNGVLGARSQQQIEITFRASLAGSFTYDIVCLVATLDSSLPTSAPDNGSEPAKMTVDASASFPTLVVEDVRMINTSTSNAWSQFQVARLNSFLMAPLTKEELKWNAESSPDLSSLTTFHLNFTPSIAGSPTEETYIQLRNPGSLVVSFRIYYPNESDVELEPWADRGEPTAEELRQNIIIDSKLFNITPRSGVLAPHESLILCISYSYTSMQYSGIHDLSVMLNVAQGKKVTLVLNGRTLPVSSPYLFLPSTTATLSPVLLGESIRKAHRHSRPALQQIPVYNTGDRPLKLEVDDLAMSHLNAHQFNFPIFECLTPQLIIPARSCGYLDIEFCPLEAQVYSVDLELMAEGVDTTYQSSTTLHIVGMGYHPTEKSFVETHTIVGGPPIKQLLHGSTTSISSITSTSNPPPTISKKPNAPPPPPQLQQIVLSQDRVDFGLLSVRTENIRVIVLTNVSSTATWSFNWDDNHPLLQMRRVRFFPTQGKLEPLQHVLVKVSIVTQDDLRVIDQDIPCWLRLVSDNRAPTAPNLVTTNSTTNLGSLIESKATTSDITVTSSRPSVITRSTISSRSHFNRGNDQANGITATQQLVKGTSESSKSLQPRTSSSSSPKLGKGARKTKWKVSNSLATDSNSSFTPPTPLYLRVFAHIVPLETFRQQYSPPVFARTPLTFIPPNVRCSWQSNSLQLQRNRSLTTISSDTTARYVVECVMGHLLTDLLHSGAIVQAMNELPEEPETPRFCQFQSTKQQQPKQKRKLKSTTYQEDLKRLSWIVLENTMFNMIQEIATGEFDLSCLPKQLVFKTISPDDD